MSPDFVCVVKASQTKSLKQNLGGFLPVVSTHARAYKVVQSMF